LNSKSNFFSVYCSIKFFINSTIFYFPIVLALLSKVSKSLFRFTESYAFLRSNEIIICIFFVCFYFENLINYNSQVFLG
jgi:hypothetical protein